MSRKDQFDRDYHEVSVTDADHPFRKGSGVSRFEDRPSRDDVSSIRDSERDAPLGTWTPKRLEQRMVEASRVIQIITKSVGPAKAKGYWPEDFALYQNDEGDIVAHAAGGRAARNASPAQIKRAEQALEWPKRFVTELRVLKVFNAWVAAKTFRRTWKHAVAAHGWSLATADRCRERALAEIIIGLEKEGIIHD